MAKWQLSLAAERLRKEINTLYPKRDKKSDGAVGDTAHRTPGRISDHNPDANGWVRAIDIDEDLNGRDGSNPDLADRLVDRIISIAKSDKRIKYVIFEGRIWSVTSRWKPKGYVGINPHNHHIHISFDKTGDNDDRPFGLLKKA